MLLSDKVIPFRDITNVTVQHALTLYLFSTQVYFYENNVRIIWDYIVMSEYSENGGIEKNWE